MCKDPSKPSNFNGIVFQAMLDVNEILPTRPELFDSTHGLTEFLVKNYNLGRAEVMSRDLPMGCVLTRFRIPRVRSTLIIDVRSNHHLLAGDGLNFDAAITYIAIVLDGRVYEPLFRRFDSNGVDADVAMDMALFLASFLKRLEHPNPDNVNDEESRNVENHRRHRNERLGIHFSG